MRCKVFRGAILNVDFGCGLAARTSDLVKRKDFRLAVGLICPCHSKKCFGGTVIAEAGTSGADCG